MTPSFAAAVYTPKQADKTALPNFLQYLKDNHVLVAGILQESYIKEGHTTRTIESVDITTGQRTKIKRPMRSENDCGLDASNLAETSETLRAAIAAKPDLILFEKFGDQEQTGAGLSDEIMQIISEGIPFLIAVPEPALTIWQERTGELGQVIKFTKDDMLNWWQNIKKT